MDEPSSARRPQLLSISLTLIIIITFVAYWPVRDNEFIRFDDLDYIARNPIVLKGVTWDGAKWAFGSFAVANWHPVTWMSHMLDCDLFRIAGAAPGQDQWAGGHHLMSVGLHAVNAVLVLLLLTRMTGAMWRSALVAGLFALHPSHVESVAWGAERKDILSTLFGLFSILAYVRWTRERSTRTYALVIVCYALSLMSKPMLVTLPFALLLLDYWPLQRMETSDATKQTTWRSLMLEKLPLIALAIASSVITVMAQRQGGAIMQQSYVGMGGRIANAIVAYARYALQTVWPSDLAVLYPHPYTWPAQTVILSALALAIITIVSIATMRRSRHNIVGWCWFLGTLVPVIGLVQVGGQYMADRYSYVPSLGLYIMIVWSAAALVRGNVSRGIVVGTSLLALTLLGAATHARARVWHDTVTLFQNTISKTNDNAYLEFLLGLELQERGQMAASIPHLEQFFARAPDNAGLLVRYAEAMGAIGRFRNAHALYARAYALDPSQFPPQSLSNFACILSTSPETSMRDGRLAVQLAAKACELSPTPNARFMLNLATAQAENGDFKQATDTAQRAQAIAQATGDDALAMAIGRSVAGFAAGKPSRDLPLERAQ